MRTRWTKIFSFIIFFVAFFAVGSTTLAAAGNCAYTCKDSTGNVEPGDPFNDTTVTDQSSCDTVCTDDCAAGTNQYTECNQATFTPTAQPTTCNFTCLNAPNIPHSSSPTPACTFAVDSDCTAICDQTCDPAGGGCAGDEVCVEAGTAPKASTATSCTFMCGTGAGATAGSDDLTHPATSDATCKANCLSNCTDPAKPCDVSSVSYAGGAAPSPTPSPTPTPAPGLGTTGAGDGCATKATVNATDVSALQGTSGKDPATWSCQQIDLTNGTQKANCVSHGCTGAANVLCCVPGTGGVVGSSSTTPPAGAAAGTAQTGASIFIPANLEADCRNNGNCTLDVMVAAAAAATNWLFGIAGSVALAIMVYGGFLYVAGEILPGGLEENVKKAQKMIKGAAFGLILMFAAYALVRFIYTSLTRPGSGAPNDCEKIVESGVSYACQVMPGQNAADFKTASQAAGCKTAQNLCPGGFPAVYCCPFEPPKTH